MTVVSRVAMISSTGVDLQPQREAARDACIRRGFTPKMMEHDSLGAATALDKSMQMVDEADVYVLILGFRYGLVPDGQEKSLTHLELERAEARGIPRIRLVMDGSPESLAANRLGIDSIDTGDAGTNVKRLRERVQKEGATPFASPDRVRAELIDALSKLEPQAEHRAAPTHYAAPLVTPPEPYIAHPYTLLAVSNLVGRQRELNLLTDWASKPDGDLATVRLLVVEAIGGMGKSALIWHWFDRVAPLEVSPLAGRVWWSFYESDAGFDNFVARTLAYATGRTVEEVREAKAPDREAELLDVLDRSPYLVVMDGIERLLLAYAGTQAAYVADDDIDDRTANSPIDFLRLRGPRGRPVPSRARLRGAADPRAGSFLRRLTRVRASRVVASSRLFPADLEDPLTGQPLAGAGGFRLAGMADDDAVDLWRSLGVTGRRDELLRLFNSVDNYPLLIRALAGEVARFRPAPGDFDAWLAAHPHFDPFSLPLVRRKSHVLQHAFAGLGPAEVKVLHVLSAFSRPKGYETLVDLLVGPDKPFAGEPALDVALTELEERSLLGWDKRSNRYDLHPVVRGVAWSTLDERGRRSVDEDLARHFQAIPALTKGAVSSLDDLAPSIELFQSLVRLGRGKDALEIVVRLFDSIQELGAYRDLLDLSQLFIERNDLLAGLDSDSTLNILYLGLCARVCGEPRRSLQFYQAVLAVLGGATHPAPEAERFVLSLRALSERQAGALAAAETSICAGLTLSLVGENAFAEVVLFPRGATLATRGATEEALLWLADPRLENSDLLRVEVGRLALQMGQLDAAGRAADLLQDGAAQGRGGELAVQASLLEGAVLLQRGELNAAGERLHEALVHARAMRLRDEEAELLVLLAEWELAGGRPDEAGTRIDDVLAMMQHDPLRLRQADALNVLSRIERSVGNIEAARAAAEQACRTAWCDGPPFSYAYGVAQATENLEAVGAAVPDDLKPYDGPIPTMPPGVAPQPPAG